MMNFDWKGSVYSDGSKYFASNPNPLPGETVTIKLRVFKDSPVKTVILRCVINGGPVCIPMERCEDGGKGIFAYYRCELKMSQHEINYHFVIGTGDRVYYYNQLEITDYPPVEEYDFRIIAGFESPEWVKKAVFYQIFPDRFYNGDPGNDVRDNEYTFDGYPAVKRNWDEKPGEFAESGCMDFFGGDLDGIRKKIPYLRELNVNALYLTPIFRAATHHKYDCADYFNVDPHFGGNKSFQELVGELHKNDIKIIIDVSINHTGTEHKWFNRDGLFFPKELGAYNNPDSEEREYYYFDDNNRYHSWFGVKTLPTLNYGSGKLRDVIYRSDNSVVKKWLKPPYSIDGWRFDVGFCMARMDKCQMHHEVWTGIRKSVKETNPRAYIMAEHWTDNREFLRGDEWDASMNYFGFGIPVRLFAGETEEYVRRLGDGGFTSPRCTAETLAKMFMQHLARLSYQVSSIQYNLYDSHDISRLHNYDYIHFESRRGVIIMQFTFPGSPGIYYGDEISIDGHVRSAEGCRYPMEWNENLHDKGIAHLHKTLGCLKQEEEALRDGGFKILYAKDYVISYARFTGEKAYVVVWSQEENPTNVDIPVIYIGAAGSTKIREVFGRAGDARINNGMLNLKLKPYECVLLEFIL